MNWARSIERFVSDDGSVDIKSVAKNCLELNKHYVVAENRISID